MDDTHEFLESNDSFFNWKNFKLMDTSQFDRVGIKIIMDFIYERKYTYTMEESQFKTNIKNRHFQIWMPNLGRQNSRLINFIALCVCNLYQNSWYEWISRLKIAASSFGKSFNTMVIVPIILIKLVSTFLSKENTCTQCGRISLNPNRPQSNKIQQGEVKKMR